jgi:uncharacterized protein YjbI with pentapeptide repeats
VQKRDTNPTHTCFAPTRLRVQRAKSTIYTLINVTRASPQVIDRVDFRKSNLKGVKFHNAVITGSIFDGADLSGADFDESLIGGEDAKRLCGSPI